MRIQKLIVLTALPLFSATLLTACSSTSVEAMCEVAKDHEEDLMAATDTTDSSLESRVELADAMVAYYGDLEGAAPGDIKDAVSASKATWEQIQEHLAAEDREAVRDAINSEESMQNQQAVYDYMKPSCGDIAMFDE
ncbi:hypothetical protein [Corynebacterium cystitidis]|uniref:Lipoprotein n=1 Tax=Corynebacterium cystitidis DSM 20524 TaxID=1121357 RepID=A0A1H9VVM8_9CORY|nr:hypothetical protein [Corynebacterium cystitidis]WJY81114.1 hypothetical protein CCYS_00650 [Corynebacterium cystitidis DSM 20524]SES25353.1 hypothetical protein SAMN05661109_02402 [Corynebacterium cystitidis DSM 20524]SNV89908.1 Uncharacterised protein [Corynebacterium cystitidis]